MDRIRSAFEGWGVLLGVPALFLSAYLYTFFPSINRIEICAVRMFLGFDCPGCGLTRSFAAMAHGHLQKGIDMHPLGLVIAIWLLYLFVRALAIVATRRRLPEILTQEGRDLLVGAFVVALLVQWVAKLVIS